jgi:hypothetical protein
MQISSAGQRPRDLHLLAEEMLEEAKGWALGDRNYWSTNLTDQLQDKGLRLLWLPTSPRKGKRSPGRAGWCKRDAG